jgi:CheY-like chemotaxis protein
MVAKKIAVIDDSRTFVELMQSILEREGYEVVAQIGSAGAFDRVKHDHPNLIILDIMMPGQSGWEVLDQLQLDPETKDIPIIISTAVKSATSRLAGQNFELLRKPFDIDVLLSKIENAIGKP